MLADLPITTADGDCLVIGGVDPADVLPVWRTALAVLPSTGRRPILVGGDTTQTMPKDRIEPAADPWQALRRPWWDLPLGDDAIRAQTPGFDPSEVRRAVPDPTLWAVNRFVFDRVRDDPALLAQLPPHRDRLTGLHLWHRPERVELLLPPVTEPHRLAGWTGFHGTLGEPEALAGALLQWHDRWLAEPVASWGTAMQFVIGRRPETADDAFEVAYQIVLLTGRLEMTLWEIAIAVTRGDEWILRSAQG